MAKTAALLGATGMTGSYLLELLLNDPYFDSVRVIVRRPFPSLVPKMEMKLVDFNDYESLKLAIDGSDVLFCAIGTTRKKVKGNKDLYRKIDFDIPVKAARICKETGCKKFVIITSVGANSKSKTFYLKLKGEVEEAVIATGIESIHIMQPSVLTGERQERRTGERFMQGAMNFISAVLPGSLKKYRAVPGRDVAAAMLKAGKSEETGVMKYRYDQIVSRESSTTWGQS